VYARFDEMGLGSEREVSEAPDWRAWSALGSRDLLPRLVNDLESRTQTTGTAICSGDGRPSTGAVATTWDSFAPSASSGFGDSRCA